MKKERYCPCGAVLARYRRLCDTCKRERQRDVMRKLRESPEYKAREAENRRVRNGWINRVVVRTPEQKRRDLAEKNLRKWHKRQARLRGLDHTLTKKEWGRTLEYFEYSCAYCGSPVDIQQDHFIPLSRGGSYTKSNIVPACAECNCKQKRDEHPLDWLVMQDHGLVKFHELRVYLEG